MKALIVDDETVARQTLNTILSQYCPEIKVIGEADGVQNAKKSIYSQQPELLFLDTDMQDGTGFDLLNHFPSPSFQVVFITAYHDYAIKAFEYNAIDYLLKPLHPDKLIRVVQKATKKNDQQGLVQRLTNIIQQINTPHEAKRISLSTQEATVILELEEICHLKSEGSYTTVHCSDFEKVVVSKLLKEFERLLPQPPFFRVHQSHIVNIHCIRKILKEEGGMVLLKNGEKIPISRRKKEALSKLLSHELIVF